jgi:hypothetical protein
MSKNFAEAADYAEGLATILASGRLPERDG